MIFFPLNLLFNYNDYNSNNKNNSQKTKETINYLIKKSTF